MIHENEGKVERFVLNENYFIDNFVYAKNHAKHRHVQSTDILRNCIYLFRNHAQRLPAPKNRHLIFYYLGSKRMLELISIFTFFKIL